MQLPGHDVRLAAWITKLYALGFPDLNGTLIDIMRRLAKVVEGLLNYAITCRGGSIERPMEGDKGIIKRR
jgi:hypothetical protein